MVARINVVLNALLHVETVVILYAIIHVDLFVVRYVVADAQDTAQKVVLLHVILNVVKTAKADVVVVRIVVAINVRVLVGKHAHQHVVKSVQEHAHLVAKLIA